MCQEPSSVVTHIVDSDRGPDRDKQLMSKACHVTVEWLEQCLALQKRLPEKNAGNLRAGSQTREAAKAEVCRGLKGNLYFKMPIGQVLRLYDHAGKTCDATRSGVK